MKKKNYVFAMLLLGVSLSLAGCGKSNPSSSSYPGLNLGYDEADIWEKLEAIGSGGNYTLAYEYAGTTYHEYYTQNYSYFEGSKMGYVGLPDYQNETEKLFYKYVINKGEVEICQALGYRESEDKKDYTPIRSASGLDYMYLLVSGIADVGVEDILTYQSGYYTDNVDLITILANVMGYGDSASLIGMITFQIVEESLVFVFYPNFQEGYEVIDGVTGTFSNIGTTRYDVLENFVASFALPTQTLTSAMLEDLQGETISLNAKVSRVWGNKAPDILEDTQYDLGKDIANVSTYYGTSGYGQVQYPSRKRYEKGQNGNAYLTYVDVHNTIQKVDSGTLFQDLFTAPVTYFEPLAFWPTEQENVYRYYGYNARWLTESLAHYDIGVTESVDVIVENGKVSKIVAKTPVYSDSYGNSYFTQAVIDVVAPRLISDLTMFTPSTANDEIATTLALFDGNTKFKANIITNKNRTNTTMVTVADQIMLVEENGYDTSEGADSTMIKIYSGYEKTAEGVVPFQVHLTEDDSGNVTGIAKASDNLMVGATLKDVIGMIACPEIFEKNSAGILTVKPMVGNLGEGVLSGKYSDYIIPDSFRLETDADGIPLSISYNYEMGEGFFLGEETIEFSEWGTAELPSHIDFGQIGLWNAPTNWKEEFTAEMYNEVVDMFGEEYVAEIPYLFSRELYGKWFLNNTAVDGYSYIHFVNMSTELEDDVYPNYAFAYAAYLEELGYVKSTDNNWGLEAYTKGDIHIRIVYNAEQVDFFIFNRLT